MRICLVLAAVTAAAGCGTAPPRVEPSPAPVASSAPIPSSATAPPPSPETSPGSVPATTGTTAGTGTTTATRTPGRRTSTGWEITVYYTAVERFHDGDPTPVTGCPRLECTNGDDDLGTYPAGFVDAVRDEGTGRTSSGRYLNWSYDVGFWLDTAPRTSDGGTLVPFVSAAADPTVLPRGTRFTIAGCGSQDDGSAPPQAVCTALRDADWEITDEFTPGLGGPKHLDAYIGPETGPGFTDSAWYVSLTGVRLTLD
ncbi:hypothetical protein [Actinoplanes italicus]|uniref:hypothetical protein n=1 Tax=Actinoplanes italicus TaxID=113567 RepID=UPI001EF349DA|nr:hypothetical protein [Actinoplanes italicus]